MIDGYVAILWFAVCFFLAAAVLFVCLIIGDGTALVATAVFFAWLNHIGKKQI